MSVSIALGSAAQIALFVAPALVLLSYVVGPSPMSLQFWPGAVTMVMIATVTASYADQIKGAAIIEPISKRQPQHPGVAHYLIHLYDYPSIAEKGLDAARRQTHITLRRTGLQQNRDQRSTLRKRRPG